MARKKKDSGKKKKSTNRGPHETHAATQSGAMKARNKKVKDQLEDLFGPPPSGRRN